MATILEDTLSAGFVTGLIIGGVLLMILAVFLAYISWKLWQNAKERTNSGLAQRFWLKYGHWFLGPFSVMLMVIGVALTFSILFVS